MQLCVRSINLLFLDLRFACNNSFEVERFQCSTNLISCYCSRLWIGSWVCCLVNLRLQELSLTGRHFQALLVTWVTCTHHWLIWIASCLFHKRRHVPQQLLSIRFSGLWSKTCAVRRSKHMVEEGMNRLLPTRLHFTDCNRFWIKWWSACQYMCSFSFIVLFKFFRMSQLCMLELKSLEVTVLLLN